MSAMYACAAEMLPPAKPEIRRAKSSSGYEPANANSRYPAALRMVVVRMIGRRPMRSDRRPRTAVARNCIPEKANTKAPKPRPLGAECLGVIRQDRHDDAEPDEIDENGKKNDREAAART